MGTVGFVQEYRTERSLEALNKLAPPKCRVLRDGKSFERLASELVPGDIVELQLGDRVPADLLLFESVGLEIDESMMTGENEAKGKTALHLGVWPTREQEALHTAYMGTLVKSGKAVGVVVATGPETELGRLFRLVEQTEDKRSPLQVSLDGLGHQLTLYSGIIIVLISLGGLLQGRPLIEIFTVAVSLAVAAIPEGLPVVATITLALGVLRLARRQVIVRKLPAVEALGAVTVLCADKTGTLTTNVLSVQSVILSEDGDPIEVEHLSASVVADLLRVATTCNDAKRQEGRWTGNAVDVALCNLADSLQYQSGSTSARLEEVPFSSDIKYMSVQGEDGQFWVKGAPEVISTMLAGPNHHVAKMADKLHARGLRTLALATGPAVNRLKLVGLVGLMDPPRPGISETLAKLRQAHLRIVMVTGDARETAMTLAASINFPHSQSSAISGEELAAVLSSGASDQKIVNTLNNLSIVYRAMPHHKLMFIQALQVHTQAIVAMTGDGVNDAPALKMADIGIAMGKAGTDVAREASKLILTDDNLASLLDGVHEGKAIFANIRHFIRFQLATSLAALGLIAASIFVPGSTGSPPLNPMQILLINIIMDGPPAQSLGVEPIHQDVLMKPPRQPNDPILSTELLARTALSAAYVLAGCLAVFAWECRVAPGDSTRTFTAFVLFSLFNAFSCRSIDRSVLSLGLLKNRFLNFSIAVALLTLSGILYNPYLSKVFQTTRLTLDELGFLVGLSFSVLVFDEAIKLIAPILAHGRYNSVKYIPLSQR